MQIVWSVRSAHLAAAQLEQLADGGVAHLLELAPVLLQTGGLQRGLEQPLRRRGRHARSGRGGGQLHRQLRGHERAVGFPWVVGGPQLSPARRFLGKQCNVASQLLQG
eukprot:891809-Prymnesium_polylepis.1